VPAAAVIPAPIAYIKVVAVKKLVVEVLAKRRGFGSCAMILRLYSGSPEEGVGMSAFKAYLDFVG